MPKPLPLLGFRNGDAMPALGLRTWWLPPEGTAATVPSGAGERQSSPICNHRRPGTGTRQRAPEWQARRFRWRSR